jgi:hypothetical protein
MVYEDKALGRAYYTAELDARKLWLNQDRLLARPSEKINKQVSLQG